MSVATAKKPTSRTSRRAPQAIRQAQAVAVPTVAFPMQAPGESMFNGLSDWESYLALDRALAERGFRVRYFKGQIEIMSISFQHDTLSRIIGRL
ncbi:MAG: hypothetical protein ACOYMN_08695, partial [Roseimicrobium sp.]